MFRERVELGNELEFEDLKHWTLVGKWKVNCYLSEKAAYEDAVLGISGTLKALEGKLASLC